jgi:hypothetical protein
MNDYLTPDAVSGLYERGAQELRTIGVTLMDTNTCVAWIAS